MSKGKEHQRHHFVPQCYLNYFSHKGNNNNFYLHTYDKKSGKCFDLGVDKACQIKYFYKISEQSIIDRSQISPLSLEVDIFANEIEKKFSIILRELYSRKENIKNLIPQVFPLRQSEKKVIAHQIAIQYLRLPWQREWIVNFTKLNYPRVAEVYKQLYANIINSKDLLNSSLTFRFDETLIHAENLYLNDNLVNNIIDTISSQKWCFCYCPTNNICTSDNPIICLSDTSGKPARLGELNTITYFPIFPDLLLYIYQDKDKSNAMEDCIISEINDFAYKSFHVFLKLQSSRIFNLNNNFSDINNIYEQITNAKP